MIVYACTTPSCPERLRGVCDEPTFCSICLRDLTACVLHFAGQVCCEVIDDRTRRLYAERNPDDEGIARGGSW